MAEYGPEAQKVLDSVTKEVIEVFPSAILVETPLDGENAFIIIRPIKGIVGLTLGKGASPIEAWSNVKFIIEEHGYEWYFEGRS